MVDKMLTAVDMLSFSPRNPLYRLRTNQRMYHKNGWAK
jgi:hypothetical protein